MNEPRKPTATIRLTHAPFSRTQVQLLRDRNVLITAAGVLVDGEIAYTLTFALRELGYIAEVLGYSDKTRMLEASTLG